MAQTKGRNKRHIVRQYNTHCNRTHNQGRPTSALSSDYIEGYNYLLDEIINDYPYPGEQTICPTLETDTDNEVLA